MNESQLVVIEDSILEYCCLCLKLRWILEHGYIEEDLRFFVSVRLRENAEAAVIASLGRKLQ